MSAALRRIRPWSAAWQRPRDGWAEVGVAAAVAALYLALLLATEGAIGYARDEGFYFDAAERYEAWFALLGRPEALAEVDRFWSANPEHPALVKSLMALSHAAWDATGLFAREGTSFRLPSMALASLGIALAYLWGARAAGRLAGLCAAGSLGAMPRVFFHAHLACFDAPVLATVLATLYAFWRYLKMGGAARLVVVGVVFGLCLDTKHNAWFAPVVCGVHALGLRFCAPRPLWRRAFAALGAMAALGPPTLIAAWPWLWHDPIGRYARYAQFHLGHVFYNMELFGRNYFEPPMPRLYAPVMTLATVPAVTLVAFAIGVVLCAARALERRRRREPFTAADPATHALWLAAIVVPYAAWLRGTTPIFGGTKHWLPVYPFMALFAGLAVAAAVRHARVRWWHGALAPLGRSRWLELGYLAAAVLVPAVQAAHAHPFGLSQYTPLVGGAPGAASLGLNRGFWGYTTGAIVAELNRAVPAGGSVYPHDTAAPSWEMLARDGRLRDDLAVRWTPAGADVALYHHELHMAGVEYQEWLAQGTLAPDVIAGLDGVPVIWTYRRP